jgi:FtsH-binding integral membrane protein
VAQLVGLAIISLLIGVIAWFWLSTGDKPTAQSSSATQKVILDEVHASFGSRISAALAVALLCAIASIMVPFLVVIVVGTTGKEWWSTFIWTVYVVGATSWVAYTFANPKRPNSRRV